MVPLAMRIVLICTNQYDRIIGYWDRFLALEPNHAQAYLERGGTKHHKGDQPGSQADLKKACELGSAKACEYLQR